MNDSRSVIATIYLLNAATIIYILYAFRILVRPWHYNRTFFDHNDDDVGTDNVREAPSTYDCVAIDDSRVSNMITMYETGNVCNLGKVGAYFLIAYLISFTIGLHTVLVKPIHEQKQSLKIMLILHSVVMGVVFLISFMNPYLVLRSIPMYLIQAGVLVTISREMV